MTTVNVNEDKYSVTVTEGATTVVTVKAPGPQGPGFPDGNLGDVTSSNTGASVVVNSGAITNAKVSASAGILGTKISPDFGSQNITTTGNAVFGGNLTVSGTTTTINTQTLDVEDINVTLGKVGSPTDITANQGGISLLGDTTKTFQWLNATDSWTSSEHIALPDNKKLKLGADNDIEIYSNGSHGFIQGKNTQNGQLHLNANNILIKNAINSKSYIRAYNNGSVELYFDNVKKAETSADGFDLPDNSKLQLGDSQDLQIFHDSSHSVIKDAGTGQLKLLGSTIAIKNGNDNKLSASFVPNGAVSLFFDNQKKVETSSTGLDVTGAVKASTGILFGSDTADANTLDDYEEGTFTPTLEGTSSNPTVNYHFRSGHYTKIGNVVHVQIVVIHDSYTGGSGEWQCGGLPFTASSTATASYNFNWNQNNRINWGTSTLSLGIYVSSNTNRFRGRRFASNINNPLNLSSFSNSQRCVFGIHGSYIAA